jgi:hypothetical protein
MDVLHATASLVSEHTSARIRRKHYRKEDLMSDQQAIPPHSIGQQFSEGTPVYDVNGEQVGTVSKHSLEENTLLVSKGIFFHRDIQVPLSTVQRSDPKGIYLNISKDELQHERYAAPRTMAESDTGGLIIQGVDVIEQTPDTITKGVGVIEPAPDTITKGVDVVEPAPDTITKGEDVIEPTTEGPITGEK